jgi:hypothetical protein
VIEHVQCRSSHPAFFQRANQGDLVDYPSYIDDDAALLHGAEEESRIRERIRFSVHGARDKIPRMKPCVPTSIVDRLAQVCRVTPELDVLLLIGSRARGDALAGSDWDFGYIAREGLDLGAMLSGIMEIVGTDRIDLADLERAGGLLRFRAARDGRLIYEARPRLAEQFRLDAAQFWCDAAPILQRGYEDVLAELGQ